MAVNQELLERYHSNHCTAEERKQVEEWLLSDEVEDLDPLPLGINKSDLKERIWEDINGNSIKEPAPVALKTRSNTYFMFKGAIAASLLIALFGAVGYWLTRGTSFNEKDFISLNNSYTQEVKHINSNGYNVAIGPNTVAKINNLAGVIDLSGSLLISPKKDIDLLFEGTKKKVTLKKGQTYIILKNKAGDEGIIVVSERNLMDLPPVMQKQITTQFDI
jgi:hypothetical protein